MSKIGTGEARRLTGMGCTGEAKAMAEPYQILDWLSSRELAFQNLFAV